MKALVLVLLGIILVASMGLGCDNIDCETDGDCFDGEVCRANACMPSCDPIGECGDAHGGCIECAQTTECQGEMERCLDSNDCQQFMLAIEACAGPGAGQIDEVCFEAAKDVHSAGFAIYHEMAVCVMCRACSSSCGQYSQGCR